MEHQEPVGPGSAGNLPAPPSSLKTVPVTVHPQPLPVTIESGTDWLPIVLVLIPAVLVAIATVLIWWVNRRMVKLQEETTGLHKGMQALQEKTVGLQEKMVDFESRPALQVAVEQTPRECPQDPEESERRWQQLRPEQKFRGLLVTNKGKGPATLKSLVYADGQKRTPLQDAHLPTDVTVFYPCEGLIGALLKAESKECFILYADPRAKTHRQYIRINMEAMTAVPLRCVEDSRA